MCNMFRIQLTGSQCLYCGPRPLCAGPGLAELRHDLGGDVPSGYGDGVRGVGELGDLDELVFDRSLSYIYQCQNQTKICSEYFRWLHELNLEQILGW